MTDVDTAVTDGNGATDDAGLVDDDGIVLLKTGWIRTTIDGRRYRLRRPLFGELKKLRLALEDVVDLIAVKAEEADTASGEVLAKAREYADAKAGPVDVSARQKAANKKLAANAKAKNRALIEAADDARVEWWALVFDTLGVDNPKAPADWPSWVVNPDLPAEVMNHWRSAPLAPGR